MKQFDDWWDDHEPSYSSNPKDWAREAFQAGMLAAADIAGSHVGPRVYEMVGNVIANKIRATAKGDDQ